MNVNSRVIFVVASLAAICSANANLVANGGFEADPVTPGTAVFLGSGNSITDWEVFGSAVALVSKTYAETNLGMLGFNSNSGDVSLDLTGNGNQGMSGVKQTFSTVAGSNYSISFYLGKATALENYAYPGSPYSSDAVVNVSVDGVSWTQFSNSSLTPLGAINWKQEQFSFTASSNSTTLWFMNGTILNSCNFVGIDDVSVEGAVGNSAPGPAAVLPFMLGLAGATRRRLKKS